MIWTTKSCPKSEKESTFLSALATTASYLFFSPKKGEALLILLEEKKGEGHFNSHAAHS